MHFEFRLCTARAQRRHGESGDRERIGEIQLADFRHHLKVNIAVRHDHRREFQFHPELAELNGHRGESLAWLDDWERKFASRQETRLFAVYRDQIRLGQNLQQVFLLEGLNHDAKV